MKFISQFFFIFPVTIYGSIFPQLICDTLELEKDFRKTQMTIPIKNAGHLKLNKLKFLVISPFSPIEELHFKINQT